MIKAKKYKVSEWFDEWMKLYKIGRIKANTVRGYVDGFERVQIYWLCEA